MKRLNERVKDFENACLKLEDGLKSEENEIVIDGILHRFEFIFELAWKCMKDYLEYQGLIENTGSPREVIRLGFKQGIIMDGEMWIDMMLARNSLSHLYNEETSRKIYAEIKDEYIGLLIELKNKLKEVV